MAKRRKTIQRDPFGNLQSTSEEEETDDVFDANGVLKDGCAVRVSMTMMDSLQRDVAKHAPTITDPARHRPGFRDSRDSAALDALEQAYRDADAADANAWRSSGTSPGKPSSTDARTDDREAAYAAYDDQQQNAWR
jgi:hypothetical protein